MSGNRLEGIVYHGTRPKVTADRLDLFAASATRLSFVMVSTTDVWHWGCGGSAMSCCWGFFVVVLGVHRPEALLLSANARERCPMRTERWSSFFPSNISLIRPMIISLRRTSPKSRFSSQPACSSSWSRDSWYSALCMTNRWIGTACLRLDLLVYPVGLFG